MKVVLLTLALAALAVAAPPGSADPGAATIVRSDYNLDPNGAYNFGFETDNGIARQETGEVKEALDEENKPHTVVVQRGSYSYVNEDGSPVKIDYFADETGFHAEGDSIPKQPVVRR